MNPMPVAVNKAKVECGKCLNRMKKTNRNTVLNLGRHLHPKSLFLRIVKVDEPSEEKNDRCPPEHWDITYESYRKYLGKERGVPTANP